MQGDCTLMKAKPGKRMPSSMSVASPAMSAGGGGRDGAAADRESVTIAAGREHEQIRVRELDALRDRQRAAMHRVEPVRRRVARDAAGTADARHEGDLVRRAPDRGERAVNRLDDAEVAASGTPDRLQLALVVLRLKYLGSAVWHHISVSSSISVAVVYYINLNPSPVRAPAGRRAGRRPRDRAAAPTPQPA